MSVGEEAAADGGAVLGGVAVAVEEVELVGGFGGGKRRAAIPWFGWLWNLVDSSLKLRLGPS